MEINLWVDCCLLNLLFGLRHCVILSDDGILKELNMLFPVDINTTDIPSESVNLFKHLPTAWRSDLIHRKRAIQSVTFICDFVAAY